MSLRKDQYCKVGDLVIADAAEDYEGIGKTIEIKSLGDEKILAGLHTIHSRPKLNEVAIGFGAYLMQTWINKKANI